MARSSSDDDDDDEEEEDNDSEEHTDSDDDGDGSDAGDSDEDTDQQAAEDAAAKRATLVQQEIDAIRQMTDDMEKVKMRLSFRLRKEAQRVQEEEALQAFARDQGRRQQLLQQEQPQQHRPQHRKQREGPRPQQQQQPRPQSQQRDHGHQDGEQLTVPTRDPPPSQEPPQDTSAAPSSDSSVTTADTGTLEQLSIHSVTAKSEDTAIRAEDKGSTPVSVTVQTDWDMERMQMMEEVYQAALERSHRDMATSPKREEVQKAEVPLSSSIRAAFRSAFTNTAPPATKTAKSVQMRLQDLGRSFGMQTSTPSPLAKKMVGVSTSIGKSMPPPPGYMAQAFQHSLDLSSISEMSQPQFNHHLDPAEGANLLRESTESQNAQESTMRRMSVEDSMEGSRGVEAASMQRYPTELDDSLRESNPFDKRYADDDQGGFMTSASAAIFTAEQREREAMRNLLLDA
ncbi:TPA: hypothetical protein N0F65_002898 [Lagenidium giganteum]|uniref:Uncharacterized protein n=1 Tax=Lagenidium giganteum TaxID=4803 RepID=A0AAV2ZBY4_9STRA|nr:TPA: hypothetical protein N0F65_002898 [Lagenidium giganteum]